MEELNLKDFFNIFWKRKIDMSIILLVTIIIGSIYSFYIVKPVYTSYTSLLLIPEEKFKNNIDKDIKTVEQTYFTLNSELIETYDELIKSKKILKQVVDELQIEDLNEEIIRSNINTTSTTNMGLIKISVTNSTAEYAQKIANKIAEIFDEQIADTYVKNTVYIIDTAEISTVPSNINHKKDIIIFTLMGIVLATGYALIKYLCYNKNK